MDGCGFVTISDMALYGGAIPQSSLPNVTLIQFNFNNQHGQYSAGLATIRNVLLVGAQRGIQMGSNGQELTCDHMLLERVVMERLGVGFFAKTLQSVGHRFNQIRAVECPTVARFEEGGFIDIDAADILKCGEAQQNGHYAFEFLTGGPNVRTSRLTAIRAAETPKLLLIDGDHRIVVDSLTEVGPGQSDPIVRVKDGAATFHGSSFATAPVLEWAVAARRTTVRFRDCIFPVEPDENGGVDPSELIDTPAKTDCFYSFERCDGDDNVPFNDMKTAW
jgi:hypothetical protein